MHHMFPLKPWLLTHHAFKTFPYTINALIYLLSWWKYGALSNVGLSPKKRCEIDESWSSLAPFTFSPFPWFSSCDWGLEPSAYPKGVRVIELLVGGIFPLLYEIPHIGDFQCFPFIFPLYSYDHWSPGSSPLKASFITIRRRNLFTSFIALANLSRRKILIT